MLQHYSLIALTIAAVLAVLLFLLRKYHLSWFGKIVGFMLGFTLAQAPGAMIGVLVGHLFDMISIARIKQKQKNTQQTFTTSTTKSMGVNDAIYFDTLFSMLGAFAAGNKVVTPYLKELHNIMQHMQLNETQQRSAWDWFEHGQHADFNLRQALFGFTRHCGMHSDYSKGLLKSVVRFANLHKPINEMQYTILTTMAHTLQLSTTDFSHLASKHQSSYGKKATPQSLSLEEAYNTLKIKNSASNAEFKWAYRKLMGRYHPDRLMSKDLPEEFMQLATRRTQEIKTAYNKIAEVRGMKK